MRFDNLRITGNPATNSTLYHLYGDHLGSTSVLADSSGQVVDKTYYLPFGEYRRGDSSILTESGFTGHLHNDSLGLIYMNARFYSPSSGRFITADTIVPDPSNPQTYNRYSYVYNNPLNLTDPSGHAGCSAGNRCVGNNGPISVPSSSAASSPMTVNVADEYSDWYSGSYSGCTMCHAGTAYGQTALTNSQLAAYDSQLRETGVDTFRIIEPIDWGVQTLDCAFSGCNLEQVYLMAMPFMSGGMYDEFASLGDELDNYLGDLTRAEIDEIQNIVDMAGRPLEVVGSAATGTRRSVGTDLPIGKGPGTRSDIDYMIPHSSATYFQGLEGKLPSIDPNMGPIYGVHNPYIGPAIRFEPNTSPYYVPNAQ